VESFLLRQGTRGLDCSSCVVAQCRFERVELGSTVASGDVSNRLECVERKVLPSEDWAFGCTFAASTWAGQRLERLTAR
jgi:hypothetical protein